MSFGFAQACESSPKVLFTSTCQHWPSSYRAESIMAILSALIVSPEFANVTIFTDSKNIIIDTWDYHIFVLFLNNKIIYCDATFNQHKVCLTLEWDSRKFIAQTSLVKGFKSFFNLSRNTKYRRNNVEWESTFLLLSCDESSNTTSFQASALKAQKLKNFLQLNR
ncbi:unnamed protein product [Rhizophagus irregularis]|nr:unnamed protein product [Rhizophagus irregularis]